MGSTRFTEQISSGKYPEYAAYQSTTSAVIPWWSRRLVPAPAVSEPTAPHTGWESS
jgi:hypothetical protein